MQLFYKDVHGFIKLTEVKLTNYSNRWRATIQLPQVEKDNN